MSRLIKRVVPVLVFFLAGAGPLPAQFGGYGGMYDSTPSRPGPTETPTPDVPGRISLSLQYISPAGARSFPASVEMGGQLEIHVRLGLVGRQEGNFRLSALLLDSSGGTIAPGRTSMSGPGTWTIRYRASQNTGRFPLLVVAKDLSGELHSDSAMVSLDVSDGAPLIVTPNMSILPKPDKAGTRIRYYSWAEQIHLRNFVHPKWKDNLAEDLYRSHAWKNTIANAVKIDRDRLNITHFLPPKESFKSYTKIEPLISRYWADTGITVSTTTANEIGNFSLKWRAQPELRIKIHPSIAGDLVIDTTPINMGRVLNGVGAAMILLDFWSNMLVAETPVEAREAWYKAGYSSLDLTFANIVGSTFGAAAALPGMWASYILTNSYDTLISGHKKCWFTKFVQQALAEDYLSEDIDDTRAVEKVKTAMGSPGGLKAALISWWNREGDTWVGEQGGGCGNWDLAVNRGYTEAFSERIQKTTEIEINGRKIHPWSFYYSVSRMIVLDRERELAREAVENLARVEAAWLSNLASKQYQGHFMLMSSSQPSRPLAKVSVCLEETRGGGSCATSWTTDAAGNFTVTIPGHRFSPKGDALLSVRFRGSNKLYVIPQASFEEVQR